MRWARGSGKVSASTATTPLNEPNLRPEGLSYRNHAPGAVGRSATSGVHEGRGECSSGWARRDAQAQNTFSLCRCAAGASGHLRAGCWRSIR